MYDSRRPEEAEQGQEEGEEAGEGLRRLPGLRLAHQADPQAPRTRPQQGKIIHGQHLLLPFTVYGKKFGAGLKKKLEKCIQFFQKNTRETQTSTS